MIFVPDKFTFRPQIRYFKQVMGIALHIIKEIKFK
jgi:hypothetical protein